MNRLTTTLLLVSGVAASAFNSAAQQTNTNTLPDVVVTGQPRPAVAEDAPVGPYRQPEWTTERRFPGTRIYLQQMPGNIGFEQWARYRDFRDGTSELRQQEEIEVGLPYRFQLDLYETWAIDQDRRIRQDEYSAELRYALADWGKIPLNPTLYLEYAQHNAAPNTLEGKLLLGDDFTQRWHWGMNLACEQELSGTSNTELAASEGISYTLVDEKFSAGAEMEFYHEKSNGMPEQWWLLIGPDLQWRPTARTHLDFAPLIGCSHDSPKVEAYLIFGIDFGTGVKKNQHYVPSSVHAQ